MRIQVTAFLLCLVGAPSYALTLSTSGPGLAPCGDQMCVDVNWDWSGYTTDSSGQIAVVLPMPDPEVWGLTSGSLSTFPLSTASYRGWFDALEVVQLTIPPSDPTLVGWVDVEYLVLGANGGTLISNFGTLPINCWGSSSAGDAAIPCTEYDHLFGYDYSVVPGDEAFLDPLTLRYDFDRSHLRIVPLSEEFYVGLGGSAHLVYESIIPEPSTRLLVMTGLLGLAYRQRWHGRAA